LTDSNVYIVSPPTLYLPGGGLSFCLISNDEKWQTNIIELFEKELQNQLTFFATETSIRDPKAWVWYWHVADNCSMVVVDATSCTEHEIRMALAMCKLDMPVIFHVKPGNDEFVALLNAIQIPSFTDISELMTLMEAALVG
jgi:hypothetical protein